MNKSTENSLFAEKLRAFVRNDAPLQCVCGTADDCLMLQRGEDTIVIHSFFNVTSHSPCHYFELYEVEDNESATYASLFSSLFAQIEPNVWSVFVVGCFEDDVVFDFKLNKIVGDCVKKVKRLFCRFDPSGGAYEVDRLYLFFDVAAQTYVLRVRSRHGWQVGSMDVAISAVHADAFYKAVGNVINARAAQAASTASDFAAFCCEQDRCIADSQRSVLDNQ